MRIEKKIILYPLDKKTIDNKILVDYLHSLQIVGKRFSDGREGLLILAQKGIAFLFALYAGGNTMAREDPGLRR